MKRSEMIEIIYNTIVDSDWIQYGEFRNGAKKILDVIEENGMIPPVMMDGPLSSPEVIDHLAEMGMYADWEPEEKLGFIFEVDEDLEEDEWYIKDETK